MTRSQGEYAPEEYASPPVTPTGSCRIEVRGFEKVYSHDNPAADSAIGIGSRVDPKRLCSTRKLVQIGRKATANLFGIVVAPKSDGPTLELSTGEA